MTNEQRAALIAVIQSVFPVLNILGVLHMTSDEISIVMLLVTNAMTTLMLFTRPKSAEGS